MTDTHRPEIGKSIEANGIRTNYLEVRQIFDTLGTPLIALLIAVVVGTSRSASVAGWAATS
jgi:hypothetical protein